MIFTPDSPFAVALKPASHYLATVRTDDEISILVVHTAECALVGSAAEGVQNYFSMKSTGVSAHYEVDPDSVEQSVPESAIAYAAGHHGNLKGIHVELAGRARQTVTDWASPDNRRMLLLAAELLADVAQRRGIPLAFVDRAGVLAGERGVTTHAELARAYPSETNHYDPGPAFPMDDFLALARTFVASDTDPPGSETPGEPDPSDGAAGAPPCP